MKHHMFSVSCTLYLFFIHMQLICWVFLQTLCSKKCQPLRYVSMVKCISWGRLKFLLVVTRFYFFSGSARLFFQWKNLMVGLSSCQSLCYSKAATIFLIEYIYLLKHASATSSCISSSFLWCSSSLLLRAGTASYCYSVSNWWK
jgi:hypothetical protein